MLAAVFLELLKISFILGLVEGHTNDHLLDLSTEVLISNDGVVETCERDSVPYVYPLEHIGPRDDFDSLRDHAEAEEGRCVGVGCLLPIGVILVVDKLLKGGRQKFVRQSLEAAAVGIRRLRHVCWAAVLEVVAGAVIGHDGIGLKSVAVIKKCNR